MTVYSIAGVDYDGTLLPATNRAITPGANQIRSSGGGDLNPTHTAVTAIDPRITLDTMHIAAALGITGTTGAAINSGALLTLFSRQLADGGTFSSGSNHVKYVMNKGLLLPRQLSASIDGATISLEAIGVHDGTNEVIVVTSGQAFGGESTVSQSFIVGPASINGTAVNNVQSLEINFGLIEQLTRGSGSTRHTHGAVRKQEPVLTFTTTDAALAATIGAVGTAQGLTDSVFYLRKIADGGNEVADATTEHISFTLDKGLIQWQGGSGSDMEPHTFAYYPDFDGSAAIIVINAAVAIP